MRSLSASSALFVARSSTGCRSSVAAIWSTSWPTTSFTTVFHYNEHRPHRALGQIAPCGTAPVSVLASPDATRLRRTDRLDGLTHEYELAA